jgi:hypothetical protein
VPERSPVLPGGGGLVAQLLGFGAFLDPSDEQVFSVLHAPVLRVAGNIGR